VSDRFCALFETPDGCISYAWGGGGWRAFCVGNVLVSFLLRWRSFMDSEGLLFVGVAGLQGFLYRNTPSTKGLGSLHCVEGLVKGPLPHSIVE
jgi:hypothetical protein